MMSGLDLIGPEVEIKNSRLQLEDDVMDPQKAKPLGLYFYDLINVTGPLAQILVKDGLNYYLPYRIITGQWKATLANLTSKDFIEVNIMIGNTLHSFKLKVDYNTFSSNDVSYTDLVDYATQLNFRTDLARKTVNKLISDLETDAENYSIQISNLDASKKGIDGLKSKLKETEDKLKTEQSNEEAKNNQAMKIQEQIKKKVDDLNNDRTEEEKIVSELKAKKELIISLKKSIEDINKSINSKSPDSKVYETEAEKIKKSWEEKSDQLEKKAPEFKAPEFLKTAGDGFRKSDTKSVKENLNKISNLSLSKK